MKILKLKWLFILSVLFALYSSAFAKTIVIKGSTTILPIVQRAAEEYMHIHPDLNISVSGGGSGQGIKALLDKTTDIASSSRFVKQNEIKLAYKKGILLVPHWIAIDAVVPIVNPINPVDSLTLDQLKAIYIGKIKNWKELGWKDKRIVIISRDSNSGTYEVWHKKVLKGARVTPSALLQASNGTVVQAVSKNKYAIGYIGFGYLNKSVKGLKVNGKEASIVNVRIGLYPISRELFLFTNGWPKGDVKSFIHFLITPSGQKIVEEEKYIPLY